MKIRRFNENVIYNLTYDRNYTKPEEANEYANIYIKQIERATKAKVLEVDGKISEVNVEISIKLDDQTTIDIVSDYTPYDPYLKVSAYKNNQLIGEKSYGKGKGYILQSGNYSVGKNNEYKEYEEDVYHMVKDIYFENGLIESEPTHKIDLPQELFHNDPYFQYQTNDDDTITVYFEGEEAAEDWIKRLKISKID